MSTLYCTSLDGTRIAYDVTGTGPALLLLHGTGKTRHDWHRLGYVAKLQERSQVITVDLRGTGESDHPISISDYSIDKIFSDISCVADAAGTQQFAVCGYGFGGNVARYIAVRSDRVTALIVIGVPFGPAVHTGFARRIDQLVSQWTTASLQEHRSRDSAPVYLLDGVNEADMPVWLACFQAMRSYPVVQPADIHCPALLIAGDENADVVTWIKTHQTNLYNAGTRTEIIAGLDHAGEFTGIDRVIPVIDSFLQTIPERTTAA